MNPNFKFLRNCLSCATKFFPKLKMSKIFCVRNLKVSEIDRMKIFLFSPLLEVQLKVILIESH